MKMQFIHGADYFGRFNIRACYRSYRPARCRAALIRSIVCGIGAEFDTSNPKLRAIALTLTAFNGIPPLSIASTKSRARSRSVECSFFLKKNLNKEMIKLSRLTVYFGASI